MTNQKKYVLYMHENKINGKKYIGITKQQPEVRWKGGSGYKQNPAFWNAIQKYGWDNFEHIILLENLTREDAERLEIEYIQQYNTIAQGYNISEGGFSGSDTRRKSVLCLELNQIFNTVYDAADYMVNQKGVQVTGAPIQAVCTHVKNKHTSAGFHWMYVQEFIDKYGEINSCTINLAIAEEDNKYKGYSVMCIETGDIFINCLRVEQLTGITSVNEALRGSIQRAGTLHWKKVQKVDNDQIQDINFYKNKSIKRPIRNIELNIVYPSVREAARMFKTSCGNISASALGYSKTAKGYHWEYVNK